MVHIRRLMPDDETALLAYLSSRRASSMLMLENIYAAGIVDGPQRHQGLYMGAWREDAIQGVVAHYWNNNLITQAPPELVLDLWQSALAESQRALHGLLGPAEQVSPILPHLTNARFQLNEVENLYWLLLANLALPPLLSQPDVRCRPIRAADLEQLTKWRVAYDVELLHARETPELRNACRASMERYLTRGTMWVLEIDGERKAMSGFNATLQDIVQVGGVYTPPAYRNQGYGRAVVAGSLLQAQVEGIESAVLFTGADNLAAQRAYCSIGFQLHGYYYLALLQQPWRP